jgi:serine/threonine protein kinase
LELYQSVLPETDTSQENDSAHNVSHYFSLFFHCNTLYQTMNLRIEPENLHQEQEQQQAEELHTSSEAVGRNAWKYASKAARHMTKHSKIVKPALERLIPRFVFEELKIGKLLGSGGFNQVYEVTSVTLLEEPYMHECATKICSENQTALRTAASQRADESRFAIKFLSQETMNDPDRFYTGAADLAIEAKFLANLMHPDIIQLRGMSAAGTNGFASCQNTGFFLVLDALQCTLEDRLEEWSLSEEMKSTLSSRKLFGRGASKRKAGVLADRLDVAACVASALEYLHEQNIICKFLCLRSLLF